MKRTKCILAVLMCCLLLTAGFSKTVYAATYSTSTVTETYNWYLDDGTQFATYTIESLEYYGPIHPAAIGYTNMTSAVYKDSASEYTIESSHTYNDFNNLTTIFKIYQNGELFNTIYYTITVDIGGSDTRTISSDKGSFTLISSTSVSTHIYI